MCVCATLNRRPVFECGCEPDNRLIESAPAAHTQYTHRDTVTHPIEPKNHPFVTPKSGKRTLLNLNVLFSKERERERESECRCGIV